MADWAGSLALVEGYIDALQAWPWEEFLPAGADVDTSIIFRVGPQRSIRLGPATLAVVWVLWEGMPEGEREIADRNMTAYACDLKVVLLVPEDGDRSDETARRNLLDSFLTFVQTHRGVAGSENHTLLSQEDFVDSFDASPEKVYLGSEVRIGLTQTRSEASTT